MMFKFTREKDLNFVHIHCTVTKTNTKGFQNCLQRKMQRPTFHFIRTVLK